MNQILYVQKKINENKIIILLFIALILFLSFFFAVININNQNIINRVSVFNVDLSDLSKEDALTKLKETFDFIDPTETINIIVNDKKYTMPVSNLGITPDYDLMIENAYNIGRSKNILVNNYQILQSYIWGFNLSPQLTFNDDTFAKLMETLTQDINETKTNDSYVLTDESIIITKGNSGLSINEDLLKDNILKYFASTRKSDIVVDIQEMQSDKVDLDALYTEIYKEPSNATTTTENGQLVFKEHSIGVKFNIDDAKFLYNNSLEKEITIPLITTKPEITTEDLSNELFKDVLSTYSTKYKESEKNRSINLKLATEKINGTILLPGQIFSYNAIVGERTKENGFKIATIYANNSHQEGLGGGICQPSSNLYNVVLLANLNVVHRANHQLTVGYVPLGQDATVAWPNLDFKFSNNRTTPIKIVATAEKGVLTFSILGTATPNDPVITIKPVTIKSKIYSTQTIEDPTMEVGQELIVQNGMYGYTVNVYKIITLNGEEISNTLISTDTYNPMKKIIKVGTKPIETTEDPVTPPVDPEQPTEPTDPITQPEDPIDEPDLPPGWDVPENPLI